MARHTINISLSEKSVNEAIRQLQQYKNWLIKKTSQLVKELAEVGPLLTEYITMIDDNSKHLKVILDLLHSKIKK